MKTWKDDKPERKIWKYTVKLMEILVDYIFLLTEGHL